MKKGEKQRHSLLKKIITPLLLIMLLQSVIFFCTTFLGGVSDTLRQNAEDVLTERVSNQSTNLQSKFISRWASFSQPVGAIGRIYADLAAASGQCPTSTPELQKELLAQSEQALVSTLRDNEVTGVFLILNDSESYAPRAPGGSENKYGICIRDYDPASEYADMEDLLLIRCPSSLMRKIGCSLDTWWEALFTFSDAVPGDFYYKPLALAYEHPKVDYTNLAYFDNPHNFGQTDRQVVSYSIPLVDDNGYPFGVLGVELTVDYLKSLLPASTLYANNDGCYALVRYREGTQDYSVITYNGVLFQQCFGTQTAFTAQMLDNGMLSCTGSQLPVQLTGSVRDIQIYNHNTPYEEERLALVGLVKSDVLYAVNTLVGRRIAAVSTLGMVLGCVLVLIACRRLTKPIIRLSEKVRHDDGRAGSKLERLRIDEIDDLVESIEGLNDKINRTAIRTEFFSRMSHDMRTPMNAIIGFSSPEVLESADMDQMRDYMQKIHSSGSYLLTLVNEVLDMTKIETRRIELRTEPITQQSVVDEILPMIAEVAKGRQVNLRVDCQHADTVFYGDRQRLNQILMNLLSNAVKFTKPGGTVRLEVREELNGGTVTHRILVQDDGCGMSPEFQKKMYEPFVQEGSGEGGTGLGLSIAKQLITLMGGTINCQSSPGHGTSFTIELTSKVVGDGLPKTDDQKDETESVFAANLAGRHILLCEDHPLNAQIASRLLERRNMRVDTAVNGVQGLEKFRQSPVNGYDLILMDIRMPGMNGLETAMAIRALERPDAKTIPIIAMTANAFTEDVKKSSEAGMNAHLSKPIDPQILYATLGRYLSTDEKTK